MVLAQITGSYSLWWGRFLNGREELASKGFYCSKGLSAQQIPYGYLLPVKGEGWVWPDFLCYLQTKKK